MGSVDTPTTDILSTYSIPAESEKLLSKALLENPKIAKDIPPEAKDFAPRIRFKGSNLPSIPINWRFAESAASLKAFEACIVAALVKRKYNVELTGAEINTDHAQLFFMSTLLWQINPDTDHVITPSQNREALIKMIPDYDFHRMGSSLYRHCVTNIYRTKDGRYFHLHGSMNPKPSLDSLGFPEDRDDLTTWEAARQPFIDKMATMDSADMQHLASDVYKQAGVICQTGESFRASEHGKANAHVGLFEIHAAPNTTQKPSWWPDAPQTSAARPLAGLKVVDLTRVIAAPAVTRGLAELGASVMRVTSPNLVDYSMLHVDLSWGKWQCSLDLKTEEGKAKLRDLIKDADVVVQGYRPGVLDKYGFSQQGIIDLVKDRERGIISVRENCYGWNGPWEYRSGWQQISDACVGISAGFGRAMGLKDDEPVTPVFPNSDYMTGIAGVTGILCALMRRAEEGGSFKVDVALNYYNQWLADSVGEYPDDVWQDVWERNGKQVFRCYHNMNYLLPRYMEMIAKNSKLLQPSFFEDRESKAIGAVVRTIKPITKFDDDKVVLKYNVGTRGNGKDAPRWPDDLMIEVVQ
ncbi:putative alpha methylacyl-CoA racemase [Cladophialophora carrionii]|uniref:Putative alpha methylacyl-CoA racemase n=1 Tax=Cladophialophora carrionii TaxID=86049 RepID=A0A1C1CUW3_9EURO|nr:putative alpha methylacyl-CoA racemase [Cladophialophora carrionii]